MRVFFSIALLLALSTAALAADDKMSKQPKNVAGFLEAYNSLVSKHPEAAKAFALTDAKSKMTLPQCHAGQVQCCDKYDHTTCVGTWTCCDILK
jgi:hypothetical protein